TPAGAVAVGEVRAEFAQVVPGRAEVVVDDVEDRGPARSVAGVDQTLEPVRAAVSVARRVQVDAVVTPAAGAGELGDRHDLDRVDAERDQMVQSLDHAV